MGLGRVRLKMEWESSQVGRGRWPLVWIVTVVYAVEVRDIYPRRPKRLVVWQPCWTRRGAIGRHARYRLGRDVLPLMWRLKKYVGRYR